MKLNDKALLKSQSFIDGEWIDAISGKSFAVKNPSTLEIITHVPDMGADDTNAAIAAAHNAFPIWSNMTAKERAQILSQWYQLILENAADLEIGRAHV